MEKDCQINMNHANFSCAIGRVLEYTPNLSRHEWHEYNYKDFTIMTVHYITLKKDFDLITLIFEAGKLQDQGLEVIDIEWITPTRVKVITS